MNVLHFLKRTTTGKVVCLTMVFTVLMSVARYHGLLQGQELAVYNRFMQLRPLSNQPQQPPILLIGITEQDIQKFRYPLSDKLLTDGLRTLLSHGAKAIGVDLFRDKPDQGRAELEALVLNNPGIVLIDKLLGDPVAAPDFLSDRTQLGFADLKQDFGGTVRRALLIVWDASSSDQYFLSLPLQLALKYLEGYGITLTPDPDNVDNIKLGNTVLPRFQGDDGGYSNADDGGYQVLMDYARSPQDFQFMSFAQLLRNDFKPVDVRDKAVIIGTTAASVQDNHETPFSSDGSSPMYGVEIHASILDQLIRTALDGDKPLHAFRKGREIIGLLIWSLMGSLLGILVRSPWQIIMGVSAVVFLPFLAGYGLFLSGWWLPAVSMAFACFGAFATAVSWDLIVEYKARKQIMQLFGKFVSKEVATELWNHREEFIEEGRPRPQALPVTVMMTDLKGYTTVSESMSPSQVMDWINEYMSVMTQIVEDHHGIVEDYAGDGLKANFGAPIPIFRNGRDPFERDAVRAVDCALAMGKAFATMHSRWCQHRMISEHLRIGISTGQVIAGSVGSEDRMAYTTVGDTVNTAARLESFHKEEMDNETEALSRILIDDSTRQRLGSAYQMQQLGEHSLRGKQQRVAVYRVYGRKRSEAVVPIDREKERSGTQGLSYRLAWRQRKKGYV